ncbi:MAG TPA: GNAT family N-acetyltransferase [Chthoniobacterales bacterium]|jgi:hypothetical protein|nr:GNAT family N-acetyltransferase [Chthoniobacterales bacterium]
MNVTQQIESAQPTQSITECEPHEFLESLSDLKDDMVHTESYKVDKDGYDKVVEALEKTLTFAYSEPGYKYYIAKNGDKVVGVLLMQNEGQRYMINDVVSIAPGVGKTLAKHAIEVAREKFPNSEITLTSATEKSTAFWLKQGFLSRDSSKTASVGMFLPTTAQN